jgi:large exoprotein involved in heme utilization and adhesion
VEAVVGSGATGDAGHLTIETGQLTLSDGARINSSTFGQGNAEALSVRASESVALSGLSGNGTPSLVEAVVGSGATGDAGHLTIETGQLILTDGAVISSFTLGQGNAGAVSIQADESVTLSGLDGNGTPSSVAAVVRSGALGDAGNLTIETGRLTLTDGAGIGSATEGQGNAGAVSIQASESVTLSGLSGNGSPSSVQAVVDSEATGDAGNLTIETGQLTLTDGAVINSSTFGQGNAGTLSIQASESVTLSGLSGEGSPSLVEAAVYLGATGDGGNLTIETGQLTLSDGAYINSSTFGQGNAGAVSIQADESVTLSGLSGNGTPSVVAALVAPGATGDGGNLTIATGQLNLTDGSAIGSSTFGQGNAGALSIQADESVTLSGLRNDGTPSVVEARVGSGATGNGGKLTIETGQLTLTDGAFISSTTGGQGNAGALSLQSSESVTLSGLDGNRNPSSVQAAVGLEATGDGGKLTIETGQLTLTDGAFISSSTLGQGNAGALSLQASESITLRGLDRNGTPSFVEAVVAPQATGDAGNLTIKTGRLSLMDAAILSSQTFGNGNAGDVTVRADEVTLRDGARISVSAIGDFSPGVLRVNTDRLFLDTQSSITADTQSGSEGNIEISANSLIMRRNSNITTNARGPATGGNINITTGVLAALENSDINANSEQAQGGTVTIDAEAIFGTEFRESPTSTSDITATGADSSLSGTVSINTPEIDPTSGLVELPTTLTDVAQQIDSSCRPGQQQSEFIVTGRGGLPPNPIEAISDEATWLDLRPGIAGVLSGANRETPSVADASNPVVSSPTPPLVEAQGWVVNAQGKMELVAQGSEVTLQNRTVTPSACIAN